MNWITLEWFFFGTSQTTIISCIFFPSKLASTILATRARIGFWPVEVSAAPRAGWRRQPGPHGHIQGQKMHLLKRTRTASPFALAPLSVCYDSHCSGKPPSAFCEHAKKKKINYMFFHLSILLHPPPLPPALFFVLFTVPPHHHSCLLLLLLPPSLASKPRLCLHTVSRYRSRHVVVCVGRCVCISVTQVNFLCSVRLHPF